jgi:hypothetical protein
MIAAGRAASCPSPVFARNMRSNVDRFDVRLKGGYVALLVALGFMSCGFAPFIMWVTAISKYPRSFDTEGVTLRSGQKIPWRDLTERRRTVLQGRRHNTVTALGLKFGKVSVAIAPTVWVDGHDVLPRLSRILGEDLTKA